MIIFVQFLATYANWVLKTILNSELLEMILEMIQSLLNTIRIRN